MSAEEREKGKIAGYLAERFTRVKSEFAMILSLWNQSYHDNDNNLP